MKKMLMKKNLHRIVSLAAAIAALALTVGASAAEAVSSAEKERELIDLLRSDAEPGQKAIACKQLAIYGGDQAVPVLAPLLANKDLSSWARIALEAIPGAAADAALREALGQVQGRLLVGVINSIGVRRDARAVEGLKAKLGDGDPEVISAAGVALGRIGGAEAAGTLTAALPKSPTATRSSLAEGCIRCAEQFQAEGKYPEAVKLYDFVRNSEVPKQKVLEATRGAILARRDSGLDLLLEQLRATDKARFGIGLRTARELPGRMVTEALAKELNRTAEDRQPLLLLALADRGDAAALPTVLAMSKSGPKRARIVAFGVLERLGNVSNIPALLDGAADSDPEISQAAMTSLTRLPGNDVDADLQGRLGKASGKTLQALIQLAGLRGIESALPAIMNAAGNPDAGVRKAAARSLGEMGDEKQVPELVRLLQQGQNAPDKEDVEAALLAISGRRGQPSVPHLLSLTRSGDSSLKVIGLRALASAGGPEALAAVMAASKESDETVQDEAVRTLSSWPNTWPEDERVAEPLLELAKSGKKTSHQVLALRGYLQFVQGDRKLKQNDRVKMVQAALPFAKRPEEKRMAISALNSIFSDSSLDALMELAGDASVAEDACSAIANVAGRNAPGLSKPQRIKALLTVAEKCGNDATKRKAEEALKKLQ
jgi:HEAT repeat protein